VYDYLRGAPVDVVTHNYGTVDSIGTVMFCAGEERLPPAFA
jgi:ATP-dependent protease ClpP protease subunit